MKEKLLKFFKINYIPFLFAAVAILLELTAVLVTSGKFYIIRPWMYLTILGFLTAGQFFIPTIRPDTYFLRLRWRRFLSWI